MKQKKNILHSGNAPMGKINSQPFTHIVQKNIQRNIMKVLTPMVVSLQTGCGVSELLNPTFDIKVFNQLETAEQQQTLNNYAQELLSPTVLQQAGVPLQKKQQLVPLLTGSMHVINHRPLLTGRKNIVKYKKATIYIDTTFKSPNHDIELSQSDYQKIINEGIEIYTNVTGINVTHLTQPQQADIHMYIADLPRDIGGHAENYTDFTYLQEPTFTSNKVLLNPQLVDSSMLGQHQENAELVPELNTEAIKKTWPRIIAHELIHQTLNFNKHTSHGQGMDIMTPTSKPHIQVTLGNQKKISFSMNEDWKSEQNTLAHDFVNVLHQLSIQGKMKELGKR